MANLLFFKKVLPFSKGTFHFLETFHPFKKAFTIMKKPTPSLQQHVPASDQGHS
jgi:hypothetical protein